MQALTPQELLAEYAKNAVIPPPTVSQAVQKQTRLLVSSAARDVSKYPSPSDYTVAFDRIQFVTKLELLAAHIPFPDYTVDATNNVVYFSEDVPAFDAMAHQTFVAPAKFQHVTVPPGTYTGSSLAAVLGALLNAAAQSTVSVAFDPVRARLRVSSDLKCKPDLPAVLGRPVPASGAPVPFALSFMNNGQKADRTSSARRVMGFDVADYYGALAQPVSMGAGDVTFSTRDAGALLSPGDSVVLATPVGCFANVVASVATGAPGSGAPATVTLRAPMASSFAYGVVMFGRYDAPFAVDLAPKHVVSLHVDNFAKNISADSNDGLHKSFAVIYREPTRPFADQNYFKIMSPPLSALERMHVFLLNADGSAFDTQNREHVLEFLITHNNGAIYN